MLQSFLRANVESTLRELLVTPGPAPRDFRIDPAAVGKTTCEVLDAMVARRFRVGDAPEGETYDELRKRIQRFVERSQPIRITMGYSPIKNLNACSVSRCDWGEAFALCYLATLHNRVQELYPPGLRFRLIFDDTVAMRANRTPKSVCDSYIGSIRQLIRTLRLEHLFVSTMRHSSFAWLFHFGLYQMGERFVRRWERDPANAEQLEKMTEYACRNVVLPPGLPEDRRREYAAECSHRFRVYWEAMRLSGLPKLQTGLIGMYLDGKQHHIAQPCALHFKSVSKGQWTQPWEGEGALLDNGHGKLVPFVITATRRQKYEIQHLEHLDIVPLPGFDRIAVAAETAAQPSGDE